MGGEKSQRSRPLKRSLERENEKKSNLTIPSFRSSENDLNELKTGVTFGNAAAISGLAENRSIFVHPNPPAKRARASGIEVISQLRISRNSRRTSAFRGSRFFPPGPRGFSFLPPFGFERRGPFATFERQIRLVVQRARYVRSIENRAPRPGRHRFVHFISK